jgi:LacI family transcriptional regulator
MADVARSIGLARATVSHVLNGRGDELRISRDTQKRVHETVRAMGYRVSFGARSTRRRSSGCIGLVAMRDALERFALSRWAAGISCAALEHDYYMMFVGLNDGISAGLPRFIRDDLIEGVVVLRSSEPLEGLCGTLKRSRIPSVWLQYQQPYDAVWLDHAAFARTSCTRLLELGHRRICLLSMTAGDEFWNLDRRRGYEQTMKTAGLQPWIVDPDVKERADRPAHMRRLLAQSDRPTGVIANGYTVAFQLYQVALEMGLRIPRDLSVIAVDDIASHSLMVPPLTHWDFDNQQVGYKAGQMLLQKLARNNRMPSKVISGQLVSGGSVASPPTQAES